MVLTDLYYNLGYTTQATQAGASDMTSGHDSSKSKRLLASVAAIADLAEHFS
jgi:hypothetical protein